MNHIGEHYRMYCARELHDHFGDLDHQLAAIAYNAMMEYYYLHNGGPTVTDKLYKPMDSSQGLQIDSVQLNPQDIEQEKYILANIQNDTQKYFNRSQAIINNSSNSLEPIKLHPLSQEQRAQDEDEEAAGTYQSSLWERLKSLGANIQRTK
jgi:hypothetical protein